MRFSYVISFFSHPIWLPIYGAMIVLFNIPFFLPFEMVRFTWLLLLLVTIALPSLIYLILFVRGWLQHPFIVPAEKQKWLLCGYIVMLLVVAFSITTIDHYPILWVYLMNLAVSCLILLLLHFFKFPPNIFVMGMGALMVFTLLLSLSFEKDMTYLIAAFTFMSGATITAQYYLTAQPLRWLLLSWGIGALPQLSLMLLLKNLLFGFH